MSGIVNSTGAKSGVIGTTVGTPTGGMLVQVSTTNTATTETTGLSNNVFIDCVVTHAITPLYSNSDIHIYCHFGCVFTNTSGDGGYSTRWKRAISGGATSYPTSLSDYTVDNMHTRNYHGRQDAEPEQEFNYWFGVDANIGTTNAVTYTLQYGTYNAEVFAVGATYGSRWKVTLMEIKR